MQRIIAIHDLSAFSHTSLGVVIPILTTLGIQVCPLPTAILSSGTSGYKDFYFQDLSQCMHGILDHWKSMSVQYDAVYSGFLGSSGQVDIVAECIDDCMKPGGLVIVDPVMGDDGIMEPTMTDEMIEKMRWLTAKATCITPNLTESALLLNEKYPHSHTGNGMEEAQIKEWLCRLAELGPSISIITSVPIYKKNTEYAVFAYDKKQEKYWKVTYEQIPIAYPGTGDIFTSVLTGNLMQGEALPVAIDRATQFVLFGIRNSLGYAKHRREGIFIEKILPVLLSPITNLSYSSC